MSVYLLTLPVACGQTLYNGVNQMVVAAGSEAAAKLAAAAKYGADNAWSQATATALVDTTTIATAGALVGYRFIIDVEGTGRVEVTGATTTLDTIDEIGTALATALNALADIANASYVAAGQTLIVATGAGDALGDKKVTVTVLAPVVTDQGGNQVQGNTDLSTAFVASTQDEGLSSADLIVTFNADTTILPKVLAVGKQ